MPHWFICNIGGLIANTETTINAVINPKSMMPHRYRETIKALEHNNFVVHYFETGTVAVNYLQSRIQNKRWLSAIPAPY